MLGQFDWALDIETMGDLTKVEFLPSPKISKALKDPAKIKLAMADGIKKQIDKMAISPFYGKVACICVENGLGEKISWCDLDEEKMLSEFYAWVNNKKEHRRFISFNGKGFDFPFAFKRMAINGVCSLERVDKYITRYHKDDHLDLMHELHGFTLNDFVSLDDTAGALLGKRKIEFDVTKIGSMMETEEGRKEIVRYCEMDTSLTMQIAKKLSY